MSLATRSSGFPSTSSSIGRAECFTRTDLRGRKLEPTRRSFLKAAVHPSAVLGLDVHVDNDRLRFYAGSAMLLETEELITRLEVVTNEALERAKAAEDENERLRAELEALRKR